jgi:superoxide reductase
MDQINSIYKCGVCGHVVQVLHAGAGQLVCCNQPMEMLTEKSQEEGMEKHLPVIEKTDKGIKVKIGSILHPMEEKHYIEWIQIIAGDKSCRKYLKPGDAPEAEFEVDSENIIARAYCNVHGLWIKK